MIRRIANALGVATLLAVSAAASPQTASIDEFFSAFTDEWVRANPSLATSTRYFTGAEQDALDRQITSQSIASLRERIVLAQHGLATLATFDRRALDAGEASEVERYVVNPGQACSYMIGQLEILELRDRARQSLGDRFSLKDFHSVVLDTATVPLNLLAEQVDTYIAAHR